jgi:hypothetical protein
MNLFFDKLTLFFATEFNNGSQNLYDLIKFLIFFYSICKKKIIQNLVTIHNLMVSPNAHLLSALETDVGLFTQFEVLIHPSSQHSQWLINFGNQQTLFS